MRDAERYTTLDGMRGLAALCVVAFHLGQHLPLPRTAGFLAVDFFFLLSGFVLGLAYDARLRTDLTLNTFFGMRIARLYPYIFLGAFLAVARGIAAKFLGASEPLSADILLIGGLLGFLLIPMPFAGFPMFLNVPAWSLLYELAVNMAYGGSKTFRTGWVLMLIVASSALVLTILSMANGTLNGGYTLSEWPIATSRVLFSFCLGILISRNRERLRLPRVSGLIPSVALTIILLTPSFGIVYELLFVFLSSPLILVVGMNARPFFGATYLGEISYPVYATHFSLISLGGAAGGLLGIPVALSAFAAVAAFSMLVPMIQRHYDIPLRRLIHRSIVAK